MRLVLTLIFLSITMIIVPVFAQSSSESNNCPQGTRAEVQGAEIVCVPISGVERTCPSGTYQGLDNQGNFACRDIETNQIVDPNTGLMIDSQTGEIVLQDEQMGYIVIGIIVLIIIVGIAAAKSKKSSELETLQRKGWTESEKEQVRIRQGGLCALCNKPPPRWEYHHKDGNRSNNSISNCEGLCPNCHSVKTHDDV